ncbi:MAG TPA: thioredoxin family protein [Pseudonocardiaceae bacterium]|jgi:thioredoxin 1|nr:thioredoxin family protein [Pseudonocardiaceae bacterium]
MATQALTATNFDEVVTGNDVVFVCFCDFSSDACRRFASTFEASSNEHPDVVYGTVDVQVEQGLAAAANISRSPTIMAYRKGVLVYSQPDGLLPETLEDVVIQVKAIDLPG